jgi:MoaA/NifB/PqqE/SkfB family radical SAM enzyme/glycosyltransferase involved in cell wall biosynthesis
MTKVCLVLKRPLDSVGTTCEQHFASQRFRFDDVVAYDARTPFRDVLEQVRSSAAELLLFADASFNPTPDAWAALDEAVGRNPATGAFTACDSDLHSIYGAKGGRLGDEGFPVLTPWFSIIPRLVLDSIPSALCAYETTIFGLLALGDRLAGRAVAIEGLAVPAERFDVRDWMAAIVLDEADSLVRDYQRCRDHESEAFCAAVPPQLRITTGHRWADATSSPPAGDRAAPCFSILCPVFSARFLDEMIASVLNQTWPHWELLIGIDGPPAAEIERIHVVVDAFHDPRIRVTQHENMGTGPTRDRLAAIATSDFVMSIDDDDALEPNALEVIAASILANPGVRVFRAGARLVGLVERALPARPRYLINGISNDPFEVTQPFAFDRKLLMDLGGFQWDEDLRQAGEDTYLFHKIDAMGEAVVMIPCLLYRRRLSTFNLSLQFRRDEAMAHFRNLDSRFTPHGWHNKERRFAWDGAFNKTRAVYRHSETETEVVTATRFFQYQTFGDFDSLVIDLEVTSSCNAACSFCPREVISDKKQFLALDHVNRLADDLRGRPGTQVVLCGIGESTLHPQLESIVRTLRGAGAVVAMTTNGATMTLDLFRRLVEAGLQCFNFSINAATAATHWKVMRLRDFDTVVANVDRLLAVRDGMPSVARIHVSFVVCTENEPEVDDFIARWIDRPVDQIWLHPANNRAGFARSDLKPVSLAPIEARYAGRSKVVVDVFRNHSEDANLCKIAKSLAFISADGVMRLCAMDYQRATSHGNIATEQLHAMQRDKLIRFVQGEHDQFCKGCDFCPKSVADRAHAIENKAAFEGMPA